MTSRWTAALLILAALTTQPARAQAPASKDAAPAPAGVAPAGKAPGDPNVSYPQADGGTYQGPLTGQPDPTVRFYEGYNRT